MRFCQRWSFSSCKTKQTSETDIRWSSLRPCTHGSRSRSCSRLLKNASPQLQIGTRYSVACSPIPSATLRTQTSVIKQREEQAHLNDSDDESEDEPQPKKSKSESGLEGKKSKPDSRTRATSQASVVEVRHVLSSAHSVEATSRPQQRRRGGRCATVPWVGLTAVKLGNLLAGLHPRDVKRYGNVLIRLLCTLRYLEAKSEKMFSAGRKLHEVINA